MNIQNPNKEPEPIEIKDHYMQLVKKYASAKGFNVCDDERRYSRTITLTKRPPQTVFKPFRFMMEKREPSVLPDVCTFYYREEDNAPLVSVKIGKEFNTIKGIVNKVEKRLVEKRLKLIETTIIKSYKKTKEYKI